MKWWYPRVPRFCVSPEFHSMQILMLASQREKMAVTHLILCTAVLNILEKTDRKHFSWLFCPPPPHRSKSCPWTSKEKARMLTCGQPAVYLGPKQKLAGLRCLCCFQLRFNSLVVVFNCFTAYWQGAKTCVQAKTGTKSALLQRTSISQRGVSYSQWFCWQNTLPPNSHGTLVDHLCHTSVLRHPDWK